MSTMEEAIRAKMRSLLDDSSTIGDATLLKFLRSHRNSPEDAVTQLRHYARLKRCDPDFISLAEVTKKFPEIQQAFQFVEGRSKGGQAIVIVNPGHLDTNHSLKANTVAIFPFLEHVFRDEQVQVNGITVVLDARSISSKHLPWLGNVVQLKRCVDVVINSIPITFHSIQIVNVNIMFRMIFAIFKPLITPKFGQIIFNDRAMSQLHAAVDRKILPPSLGGNGPQPRILDERQIAEVDRLLKLQDF